LKEASGPWPTASVTAVSPLSLNAHTGIASSTSAFQAKAWGDLHFSQSDGEDAPEL
jgi:hypothetical protein